ncbi:MAG: SdpI family protein [Chitinophagaceae bacterium]
MKKWLHILVWPLMAIPVFYLAWVWNKLPEKVVMHFDWSGNPDRYGSKKELLILCVVLTAFTPVLYFILTNIYRIDPKRNAAENKNRLQSLAFGLVIFMSALLCMIIYHSSHGDIRFNTGIILAATGLLFAFIGNYMHNLKPNYFAGLRLPWALENEENWKRTHALAGKLWFGGGLLLAVICIFLPAKAATVIFITVMIIITAIPIVFSYRFYRKQKQSGDNH